MYDLSNAINDSTEGYRARVTGTLGSWTATTKALYDLSNAINDSTEGFRVRVTGTLGTWTATTLAFYNLSNTTADSTDGFRTVNIYTSPYDLWEATAEATYTASNTTADETDGWRATTLYTAPFTTWVAITQAVYTAGNTTADESDSYRTVNIYTTPYSLWEATTEALYNAGNTATGTADGWDATKVYTEPFTFHEASTSYNRPNRDILKQFIAPSGAVPAVLTNGVYTNAAQATYYELPNFTQFAGAMTSLALAECGGTVTLQTKVGTTNAADPFTYQSSVDLTTATTSAQYRSGTFDYELSTGTAITVTISPMETSTLDAYNPVNWACKAGGANYAFTTSPIKTGSPWTKITLSVAPNTAVSCVLTVALK